MTVLLPALLAAAAVVALAGVPAPPRLTPAARRRVAPRGARAALVLIAGIALVMSVGPVVAAVAALGASAEARSGPAWDAPAPSWGADQEVPT